MLRQMILAMVFLVPNATSAWEIIVEREQDGRVFTIAEQTGDAGSFLRLVCFEQKTHFEIEFPFGVDYAGDSVVLMQVDQRPERLIAGFTDKLDRNTHIFIGLDRRDQPAAATATLLKEIAAGSSLYLGDPDISEAFEHWSLAGSKKAIQQIRSKCSK